MDNQLLSGGDILSSAVSLFNAERDRRLREQLAEKNANLQRQMEEQRNKLSEKLERLRREQERALADADRVLQIRLAKENRKLQLQLAAFSEYSRRQGALVEIEKRFNMDNFPLYIRKENYCDFVGPNQSPAVKIVFSPPVIDKENTHMNVLSGIDVLMTAKMTKFLHETFDYGSNHNTLYEYVGNAWRDKQFRGQSAYRYIFNEFSSEPFVIVDCEVVRERLTFHLCYWVPGDTTYHIFQITDGLSIESILYESMRNRMELWEQNCYCRMKEAGMKPDEIEALHPEEYRNLLLLHKERQISPDLAGLNFFKYHYSEQDYDALIDVIALLTQIFVGVFVDLYQMGTGNLKSPRFLNFMLHTISELPEGCGLREHVEDLAVNQYIRFADPENEQGAVLSEIDVRLSSETISESCWREEYFQNTTAMVNSRLFLADIFYDAGQEEEARKYFVSAWKKWCELFGVPSDEIEQIYTDTGVKKAFLDGIRSDSMLEASLQMLHQRSELSYGLAYRNIISVLASWVEEDWKHRLQMY